MPSNTTAKPVSLSQFEIIFPFADDKAMRDAFVNSFGDLRFGKLLEEMDMAAGKIAYAHTDGFDLDLTIVTAACDRIDLIAPLPSNQDLRLSGQVNYVGRSSMEIGLRIDTLKNGAWKLVARAYFIMVARKDGRGHEIHRLELNSAAEKQRHQEAASRAEEQRTEKSLRLRRSAPNAEEGATLHQLLLQTRDIAPNIPMCDTWRQTTLIMHPQDRNIHNKVFGGHIMRLSFETAYNVAHIYCKRRPLFVCVDHFDFIKPVEIGSIVSFNGSVVFTGTTSFIVEVTVDVISPMSGLGEMTNISYFTFVAVDAQGLPTPVPKVHPLSYEEGLKYLDGAKRYQVGKKELQQRYKDS